MPPIKEIHNLSTAAMNATTIQRIWIKE